jgi:hypothetical protein
MPDRPIGDYEIVNAMARYGGSFARAVAEAASRADPANLAKLKAAFPDLWDTYAELVTLRRPERAAEDEEEEEP